MAEKYYLGIPLGVIRQFVKMNEQEQDDWLQLFEITPSFIFSESQLKEKVGSLKEKGVVVVDLTKLGGKDAN